MKWEAEQKGYTCNDCYLAMQNCHDMSICCEDETGLCDYFEKCKRTVKRMSGRKFDEMISYFNRKVSDMDIDRHYKMELLGMVTALGYAHEKECEERKTGRWIDAVIPNENGGLPVQVCDQCNTFFPLAYTGGGHRFCPNCGADMRGGQDEK